MRKQFTNTLLALAFAAWGVSLLHAEEEEYTAAIPAPPRQERLALALPVMLQDETNEGEEDNALPPGTYGRDTYDDFAERLESLESEWADYQQKRENDAAAKASESSWSLGGRVHIDHWSFMEDSPGIGFFENPTGPNAGNDPEDFWGFRRIRLEFEGEVPDNMIFRMQIDFNNPATAEMKDVYIGWTNLPNNQTLILGNQKRPLGLDHLNSSRFNIFAERPLVVESFNEDARRFGLAMHGYTDDEVVNWQYGIYNLENISRDGRFIGDHFQLGGYGRLASTPWYDETSGGRGYLHLALAGAVAHPDAFGTLAANTNNNEGRFRTRPEARSLSRWIDTGRIRGADWYEIAAMESVLNIGSFQLAGEFMSLWLQQTDEVARPDLNFYGGYVYASYFLTGEHHPWSRTSGTIQRVKPFENFFLVDRCRGGRGYGLGALELAFRYDYLRLSDGGPELGYDFGNAISLAGGVEGGIQQNYTLGLNWHWTAYSKLQANLIYGEIDNHRPAPIANDPNQYTRGDFWILGTRFMLDF